MTGTSEVAAGTALSFGQERAWLVDGVAPEANLLPVALQLTGRLDRDALADALTGLVARHEVLRTGYRLHDGRPVAPAHDVRQVVPELRDLSDLPSAQRADTLRTLLEQEVRRPLPLDAGLALRATLFRESDARHVLVLTAHRIACDDRSLAILVDELVTTYGAPGAAPEPPAVTAADFAAWQRAHVAAAEPSRRYWLEKLADLPRTGLPPDRPRPASASLVTAQLRFPLPADLRAEVGVLCRQRRVTPFIVLLAALHALIARHSGDTDVAVATPAAGRTRVEFEPLVGVPATTLVLRADLSGDPALGEVLDRVRAVALGAYDHQDVPLEWVLGHLPSAGVGAEPPVRTAFAYRQAPFTPTRAGALEVDVLDVTGAAHLHDLALLVDGPDLTTTIRYATGVFDRSTVEVFAADYLRLLAELVRSPHRPLSAVEVRGEPSTTTRLVVTGRPRTTGAARTDAAAVEEVVLGVWQEVLERDDVGPDDNFFDVGGHSHLLVRVSELMRERVPGRLRIVDFFRYPTVRGLARHLAGQAPADQADPAPPPRPETPVEPPRSPDRRDSLRRQRARRKANAADSQREERDERRL